MIVMSTAITEYKEFYKVYLKPKPAESYWLTFWPGKTSIPYLLPKTKDTAKMLADAKSNWSMVAMPNGDLIDWYDIGPAISSKLTELEEYIIRANTRDEQIRMLEIIEERKLTHKKTSLTTLINCYNRLYPNNFSANAASKI